MSYTKSKASPEFFSCCKQAVKISPTARASPNISFEIKINSNLSSVLKKGEFSYYMHVQTMMSIV